MIQQKSVTGVSSCDTEGPWKVWGKTDKWFQIQPKKKFVNFVPASLEGRNFKFGRMYFSKRYIGSAKIYDRSFILWHWRTMESLRENWQLVSNSAQKKICEFRSSQPEGQNFKFYGILLSKMYIGSAKNCGRSFIF